MKIIKFEPKYRDDLIFMILEAKLLLMIMTESSVVLFDGTDEYSEYLKLTKRI